MRLYFFLVALNASGKGQCGSGSFPSSPGVEVEMWLVVSVAGALERVWGKEIKDDGQSGVKWWTMVHRLDKGNRTQSPGCGMAREERK